MLFNYQGLKGHLSGLHVTSIILTGLLMLRGYAHWWWTKIPNIICFKVLDLLRSCNGLTQYLFLHKTMHKIGAQEVLLHLKPLLLPVGHERRPNEEIVLSKIVEFVHSVEGTYKTSCIFLCVCQEQTTYLYHEKKEHVHWLTSMIYFFLTFR